MVAALMAFWGYHWLPIDPSLKRPESWSAFICVACFGAISSALNIRQFCGIGWAGVIGVFACLYAFWESSKSALCGLSASHDIRVPVWSDLCVEQFGQLPFEIIASVALATLLVRPWEKNNGR